MDVPELDITDAAAVDAASSACGRAGALQAVVNCAAWTDVDGAETKREQAHAVNADGAGNLARAAARAGVPLVHVSTDYVFDGVAPLDSDGRPRPYVESDPTGPRSVYGSTQARGRAAGARGLARSHTVVRTAWLFGVGGRNFVETMLRAGAAERDAVQVVDDQVGSPTWTGPSRARAARACSSARCAGSCTSPGAGEVSWNGFATEIFRQAEVECCVEPASSAQMARPAPRPAWSALESERDDVLPLPDLAGRPGRLPRGARWDDARMRGCSSAAAPASSARPSRASACASTATR